MRFPRRAQGLLRHQAALRDLVLLAHPVVPRSVTPSMPLSVACRGHGTTRTCQRSTRSEMALPRGRAALLLVRRGDSGGMSFYLGCVEPHLRAWPPRRLGSPLEVPMGSPRGAQALLNHPVALRESILLARPPRSFLLRRFFLRPLGRRPRLPAGRHFRHIIPLRLPLQGSGGGVFASF